MPCRASATAEECQRLPPTSAFGWLLARLAILIQQIYDAVAAGRDRQPPLEEMLSVFAPACHLHEVIDSGLLASSEVDGRLFADVLAAWFWQDDQPGRIVDRTKGVRTDASCRALHSI